MLTRGYATPIVSACGALALAFAGCGDTAADDGPAVGLAEGDSDAGRCGSLACDGAADAPNDGALVDASSADATDALSSENTGAWAVPFGTRPASAAVSLKNCSDVTIENKTFKDLGAGVIAVRLESCSRVTIRAVDLANVAEGIYAVNSRDITIVDVRYSNILGPAQPRTGANVANFVQLNAVVGGAIRHNKGKGGDTEDVVSLYRTSNVVVEDNHFEGTSWTSGSGSGIALGDDGGSGNVARRNVLVNVGQVGIFIAGGTNHQIVDNVVYGEQRASSNVGIYVWNQYSQACSGHTVSGNRVTWYKADGTPNPYWDAGNCGPVTGSGTNDWSANLDPNAYRVRL